MLLQEHFLREALKETKVRVLHIHVDHSRGTSVVNRIHTVPVVFSMAMIEHVAQFHTTARPTRYFFRGLRTPRKQWVADFAHAHPDECDVTWSARGRNRALKYTLDDAYYRDMCRASLAFAPTDVFPWSYRLFEAVMCRAIPVLHSDDHDLFASRFRVYRHDAPHEWRSDWADHNLEQLKRYHTLQGLALDRIVPWRELTAPVANPE